MLACRAPNIRWASQAAARKQLTSSPALMTGLARASLAVRATRFSDCFRVAPESRLVGDALPRLSALLVLRDEELVRGVVLVDVADVVDGLRTDPVCGD